MTAPTATPTRLRRSTIWAATGLLLLSIAASVLLSLADSRDHALVLGPYGASSLMTVALCLMVACSVVAACGWAWEIPPSAGPILRNGARTVAVVLSLTVLFGLFVFVFLASIGGSTRYVDVGSTNGHTITVAEYSSLGGTSLQLGERSGWYFTPSDQLDAWATGNQVPDGPPPSQRASYEFRVQHGQVVVDFGGPGSLSLTMPVSH